MFKLIVVSCLMALSMAIVDDQTVNVAVYYESLCPDSIDFINKQLYPTYQQLKSIISLQLIVAGNSNVILNTNIWLC